MEQNIILTFERRSFKIGVDDALLFLMSDNAGKFGYILGTGLKQFFSNSVRFWIFQIYSLELIR